jgi:hypothetical protein
VDRFTTIGGRENVMNLYGFSPQAVAKFKRKFCKIKLGTSIFVMLKARKRNENL